LVFCQVKRNAQALMIGTEIVNTAQDIHAGLQSFRLASQGSSATGQAGQAFPKSGIKPLDESGVDAALPLAGLDEGRDVLGTAVDNAPLNGQLAPAALFEHLNQVQFWPRPQFGSSPLTLAGQLGAITGQAINRYQHRPTQRYRSHTGHQGLYQSFVPTITNLTPQPQAARNHHGHSHPDYSPLYLGFDFIRLHLSQIKLALTHHSLVNFLTMRPSLPPPTLYRPFIKAKSSYYRLCRTAIGQQGQYQDNRPWLSPQPIKYRPLRRRKALTAHFAAIALLFLTVNTDIPFANLPSCRHRFCSWVWYRNLPVCLMNPFFSNCPFPLAHSRLTGELPTWFKHRFYVIYLLVAISSND
jgi:hypothetical protein